MGLPTIRATLDTQLSFPYLISLSRQFIRPNCPYIDLPTAAFLLSSLAILLSLYNSRIQLLILQIEYLFIQRLYIIHHYYNIRIAYTVQLARHSFSLFFQPQFFSSFFSKPSQLFSYYRQLQQELQFLDPNLDRQHCTTTLDLNCWHYTTTPNLDRQHHTATRQSYILPSPSLNCQHHTTTRRAICSLVLTQITSTILLLALYYYQESCILPSPNPDYQYCTTTRRAVYFLVLT